MIFAMTLTRFWKAFIFVSIIVCIYAILGYLSHEKMTNLQRKGKILKVFSFYQCSMFNAIFNMK